MKLTSGNRVLDLNYPKVMGILNLTPDSFSDGGKYSNLQDAFDQASKMVNEGASILDIGGESTRPGAKDVDPQEELDRVIPIIEKVSKNLDCMISIDTNKALVMSEAINAGAHIINDICALQNEGALVVAAKANIPVCLMHMQGKPRSMQLAPEYTDLIGEVRDFLLNRAQVSIDAGISRENIILDLGFGFGKQLKHNYQLLAATKQFVSMGFPVLTGLSRKSMFSKLLNRETKETIAGSLAGAMIAIQSGSQIIRVHDVAQTIDVIKILQETQKYNL